MTFPDDSTSFAAISSDAPALAPVAPGRFAVPRNAGPLLLYLLIGLGILWPYRGKQFRPAGDLSNVIALSIEAERGWREGQFPVRVAPDTQQRQRYPIFQYYGNFPYSVMGGMSAFLRINPYTGWKLMSLASFLAAGYFTLRLSLWLCGNFRAATLAGAVFLCAPYLMTDLNARGAFAEMLALNLMPAAFYATARCLSSRRPKWICWCAISWTLIGLTHNITYLYGATFAAAFFFPFLFLGKPVRRAGRLALAGAAHGLMMLWYVLPQFRTVPLLSVRDAAGDPFGMRVLTPMRILLAPVLTNTPEGASTPALGLQVGWPILAGVLLALFALFHRRRRPFRWVALVCLLLGFFTALFAAWSPVDFWRHLPKPYYFVQFTYRLLVFVVVFGSALTAFGLARLFPRRVPTWAVFLMLATAGLAVASYVPRGHYVQAGLVKGLYAYPLNDGLPEYLPAGPAMRATSVSNADPENHHWSDHLSGLAAHPVPAGQRPRVGLPLKAVQYGAKTRCNYDAEQSVWLDLPVLDYPGMLDVQDNGRRVPYFNSGMYVSLPLEAAKHHITVRFVGVRWANFVSLLATIAVIGGLGFAIARDRRNWSRPHGKPELPAAQPRVARDAGRFGPGEALVGFSVLLLMAGVPQFRLIQRLMDHRPDLVSVTASASETGPENAFDDDQFTVWQADGSRPAWLEATFARSGHLHAIVLDARITTLYETWEHVAVTLRDHGIITYQGDFDLPLAWTRARETIEFPQVSVDEIDLRFSKPVTRKPDGVKLEADQVNPGYSEIKPQWDR
ncbi:MAG TPA: hypothetical protein VGI81_02460 [Tepidisphaeraceae bacterium]|jgi:hypothetical protein